MPGLIRESYDGADALDYLQWLSNRENDLAAKPHWLELGAPGSDESPPEPTSPHQVTAQRRDNISRLIGTSDPAAVGAFARVNNLRPGDSTIYAGRPYLIPSEPARLDTDRGEGLLMIRRDNARRAQLGQQKLQRGAAAELARQTFGQDWSLSSFNPPNNSANAARSAPPQSANSVVPQSRSDRLARMIGGQMAAEAGREVGYATGVAKTVGDIGKGALFFARLINPIDPLISEEGDAAWDHVFDGLGSAYRYGRLGTDYPELLRTDASQALRRFREAHDPSATPEGASLSDELERRFEIEKRNSELGVEAASFVVGAPELKGLAKLGGAAKVSTAADFAAMGLPDRAMARWTGPNTGSMKHHNLRRSWTKNSPILTAIGETPLFLVDPPDMSFGDFQRLHFGLDDAVRGNRLPGGGGWSGEKMGMKRYSLPERLWYGTPPVMKASIGTGAAIGIASAEQAQKR